MHILDIIFPNNVKVSDDHIEIALSKETLAYLITVADREVDETTLRQLIMGDESLH